MDVAPSPAIPEEGEGALGVRFEYASSSLGGGLEGTQSVLLVGEWVRPERKQGA